MLKMKFFWLIFRGKFEQKIQKSIFLQNQWKLKNIKKAIVVKNIISQYMLFTKSICDKFWRSYCRKSIFVIFHFLKFLPTGIFHQWDIFSEYFDNTIILVVNSKSSYDAKGQRALYLFGSQRWISKSFVL